MILKKTEIKNKTKTQILADIKALKIELENREKRELALKEARQRLNIFLKENHLTKNDLKKIISPTKKKSTVQKETEF